MPNWRLPTKIRDDITKRAMALTQRSVDHAKAEFPLTTAQVQCAIMREDHLRALRQLKAEGMQNIPSTRGIGLELRRDMLPGLTRGVRLELRLPESVHAPRSSWFSSGQEFSGDCRGALLPYMETIDETDRAALTTWCNQLARALRLKEMADATVALALAHAGTAYHIEALWPGLRMLIEDKAILERMRVSPRSLRAYQPKPEVLAMLGKRIRATETVLVGADLLVPYEHPKGTVFVKDATWKRLPGDPKFT